MGFYIKIVAEEMMNFPILSLSQTKRMCASKNWQFIHNSILCKSVQPDDRLRVSPQVISNNIATFIFVSDLLISAQGTILILGWKADNLFFSWMKTTIVVHPFQILLIMTKIIACRYRNKIMQNTKKWLLGFSIDLGHLSIWLLWP